MPSRTVDKVEFSMWVKGWINGCAAAGAIRIDVCICDHNKCVDYSSVVFEHDHRAVFHSLEGHSHGGGTIPRKACKLPGLKDCFRMSRNAVRQRLRQRQAVGRSMRRRRFRFGTAEEDRINIPATNSEGTIGDNIT